MEGGGEADAGGGGEADDVGGAVANSIEVTKAERSDAVNINIRRSDGTSFAVQVSRKSSVESFKSMLAQRCDIPAEKQRLVYKGWILDDERVLWDYDLVEETTVHLFGGFIPIPASNHTSNTVEEGTAVQSGGPSLVTSDTSRIAEFERIQRRLFQNPNLLPETMYRLMSNPSSLWFRMLNTPEFRVVFQRNPMFPLIIENYRIFGVMAEAVIFFELIREMMRYIDRTGGAPTFDGGRPIQGLELAGMLCSESSSTPDFNSTSDQLMRNLTVLVIRRFLLLQISETPFDPQLRETMHNSGFFHELKLVEAMQQLMDLLQSFVFKRGQQQSSSGAGQTGGRTGGGYANFGLDKVMNMFSELTPNNPHINAGPEELYARQLAQLEEVGFSCTRMNVEALIATAGNLSAAVDFILK